jgi:hypothetical protein
MPYKPETAFEQAAREAAQLRRAMNESASMAMWESRVPHLTKPQVDFGRRPVCLACGKRLPIHTRTIDGVADTPSELVAWFNDRHRKNRPALDPARITSIRRGIMAGRWIVKVWDGTFGLRGDSRWCSLGCCHSWAKSQIPPVEFE